MSFGGYLGDRFSEYLTEYLRLGIPVALPANCFVGEGHGPDPLHLSWVPEAGQLRQGS